MNNARPRRRSLKNVVMTARIHVHYLGLWIFLSLVFVLSVNSALYIIYQQMWDVRLIPDPEQAAVVLGHQGQVEILLIAETFVFMAGILALSILTAHRIAGPHIALKRTFKMIRAGNLQYRLRLRHHDRLDDVMFAFNDMMDELERRIAGQPPSPAESEEEAKVELAMR